MTHASLLINWNSLPYTLKAVESLLEQTVKPNSIYILDNNSDNFEGEELKNHFANKPSVNVFISADNLGFAKGINFLANKAIKTENPEFLFLLNNDAVASPTWIEELLKCQKETASPLVSSKLLQQDNPKLMDNAGHLMLNTGEVIPIGHNQDENKFNSRKKVLGACGGACLISTELWNNLGGFDEHFFVGYEDADFGLRAYLKGNDIYFEPNATVSHKMGLSIKKVFDYNYTLNQFRNINYTYFKLLPLSFLALNFPFFLLKQLVVFCMNLVFLRFKFTKVMLHATWLFFTKDLAIIKIERAKFYTNHAIKRSLFEIQQASTFFLWFDIKRFWRFIILRQKNQFEKY